MLCFSRKWHTWCPSSVASALSAACPADRATSPPWSAPAAGCPGKTLVVEQGKANKDATAGQLQGTFQEHVHLSLALQAQKQSSLSCRATCWELTTQHSRCEAPSNACCDCACKQCASAGSSPSA